MPHTACLWTTEPHNHTHAFGDLIDGNNETFAELESPQITLDMLLISEA